MILRIIITWNFQRCPPIEARDRLTLDNTQQQQQRQQQQSRKIYTSTILNNQSTMDTGEPSFCMEKKKNTTFDRFLISFNGNCREKKKSHIWDDQPNLATNSSKTPPYSPRRKKNNGAKDKQIAISMTTEVSFFPVQGFLNDEIKAFTHYGVSLHGNHG